MAQFRVADNLWLKGTLGRVEGKGVESDTYLLFGLSFTPQWTTSPIEKAYSKPRY